MDNPRIPVAKEGLSAEEIGDGVTVDHPMLRDRDRLRIDFQAVVSDNGLPLKSQTMKDKT